MPRSPKTEAKKPADLGSALLSLGLGDAEFGAACKPPVHRTLVWKYRTGRKIPRGDTAQNILDTLARLGVALTLGQLLDVRHPKAA